MRIEQIDRPEPGGIDADTYHRAEQGGRVAQDIPVNTQPPSHPFSSPPWTPTHAFVVAALAWLAR